MDNSIFLHWWFSFDLWYCLILGDTNNVLHSSVKKYVCTLRSLAKKSCNNINNSRAQVSRLCYFLWLWLNLRKNNRLYQTFFHKGTLSTTIIIISIIIIIIIIIIIDFIERLYWNYRLIERFKSVYGSNW